jgi:dihydroxyacetone kinase-like predicted kinase
VHGSIAAVGSDLAEVGTQVLDLLLKEPAELVTVLLGEDADDALGDALTEHVATASPDVEVLVLRGGQPRYPLLLAAE